MTNLKNLEKSIESSKRQLKNYLNGIKLAKIELDKMLLNYFETILNEAKEKIVELSEKQASKNSKNINSLFLQSFMK